MEREWAAVLILCLTIHDCTAVTVSETTLRCSMWSSPARNRGCRRSWRFLGSFAQCRVLAAGRESFASLPIAFSSFRSSCRYLF
ncbi:hypothetical protein BC835DRAFT_1334568 [Cytidiella melzeri]|nr:hypothetical protein BC835DRAFT_1334568 [Cytidiella melzeri]